MPTVKEHYEKHLAPYYSWLFGDFDEMVETNRKLFISRKLAPENSKIALDLGAGPGFASIALAQMGYRVIAVDMCQSLLDELTSRGGDLDITPVRDDILNFTSHCHEKAGLCVCMGDTLTHLESFVDVKSLFADVYSSLETGGKFVLNFRDLVFELKGNERFIPVKSDPKTIFTCVLEYEKEHVIVNDMIYKKEGDMWKLDVSSYRKLRIPPERVRRELLGYGFKIDLYENNRGMITIIAGK